MTKTWVIVLAMLLLAVANCRDAVVIQSDLDGEEIREPEELIALSTVNPSLFPIPGAKVIWSDQWKNFRVGEHRIIVEYFKIFCGELILYVHCETDF